MKHKLKNVHIDDIYIGERFRDIEVKEDEELVDSIKDKGIIQPLSIAPWQYKGDDPELAGKEMPGGEAADQFLYEKKYILLAGGRRLMAAKELDLRLIPCIIREVEDELDLREVEYTENFFRKDPSWQMKMDLVKRIHTLMTEKHGKKWGQRNTAKHLDKSIGGINRVLKLHDMCDNFPVLRKEATEDNAVRKAREILEKVTVKEMVKEHKKAATEHGLEEQTNSNGDDSDEGEARVGEGFKDDPYISIALKAEKHFMLGDAFENLQVIIDRDLKRLSHFIEVDPPYGIDIKKRKKWKTETRALNRYEEIDRDIYPEWTGDLCRKLYDVAAEDARMVYWFGAEWYQMIYDSLTGAGWTVDPIPGIWVKPAGQTNNPDSFLARCYESFFICLKGDGIPLRKRGRSNVFEFNAVGGKAKYHPTQRPVDLMREILQTFAWPNTVVLCPFLGSGATLRAAYKEQMLGFGWEINEDNKERFIAAVQEDIDAYKVDEDSSKSDIPF